MTDVDVPAVPQPGEGPPPQRVRVVLADAARTRSTALTRVELEEQSPIGEALLRGLIRAQLGLSLRLAALVGLGLGALPLLFLVAPRVADVRVFGITLPWLLLGFLAYPFLLAAGAAHVHFSERIEAEFTQLVVRPEK
ncbi:MAG TPA: hypothetical protein VK453_13635 [Micromonosporaceae bacterium]|nr:hypothetical protein [Micromonosporaceae bacterium]